MLSSVKCTCCGSVLREYPQDPGVRTPVATGGYIPVDTPYVLVVGAGCTVFSREQIERIGVRLRERNTDD